MSNLQRAIGITWLCLQCSSKT